MVGVATGSGGHCEQPCSRIFDGTRLPMDDNSRMEENSMYAMIENRKIKVAMVGRGRISGKHFEAIAKHDQNVELTAVCDRDRGVLARMEKAHGVLGFDRLDSCWRKPMPI